MRATTQWSIGLTIGWFVLNIIANASAPTELPGFDSGRRDAFQNAIATANFFQSIAAISLLAAIICIIVTLYRNIMDKSVNKTIYGPNLENSPGSNVATAGGVVATGRAVVAAYGANLIINKGDEINKNLNTIDDHLKNSDVSEDEKRKARLIIKSLRSDAEQPSENKDDAAFHIKELATIFRGAGELSSAVKGAIENLATIFGK
jgi:hypothetical protein